MISDPAVLQSVAIRFGAFFVGILLIGGVIRQYRTGETYGATGRGRVSRKTFPTYFTYLAIMRIVVGIGLLVGAILLRGSLN